jgi:hypothetical protein
MFCRLKKSTKSISVFGIAGLYNSIGLPATVCGKFSRIFGLFPGRFFLISRIEGSEDVENCAKKTSQLLDIFQELLYNHAHECFAGLRGATTMGCRAFEDFLALPFLGT